MRPFQPGSLYPNRSTLLPSGQKVDGRSGCNGDSDPADLSEPGVATGAIEELRQQYDELVRDGFEDPVQWAAEDIENIGDWDYRVVELKETSAAEFEASLNELGNDRWEAFWIERRPNGYLVVMRKPSVSYLSKVPLSQLGRFIVPAPEEGQ